ncbi:Radical SAM domain protein [Citrifermentans bremense]|uniref:Radical SAM domain protein n=1 Tax=Citrifermentans bremense TaxID=60035 RepID=A0A6S6M1I8_9BACT|nr:geopeptide radical SAM maturase [Citrifermentans bremense]BCG47488.1 Radical SAM domain protein [Citrifermentans bremense]
MHLSRYLKVFPSLDKPDHFLLYSTLRGSMVAVPAATLQALQQGEGFTAEAETLSRLGMLVPDPDTEKEQMRGLLERANGRSRNFKAMVVLNLDCNLDCGYCYEGQFRGGHYMSGATADLLVQTFSRDRICQGWDLTLSFYGGEPLLSLDLIERISRPLQRMAREKGVKFGFNLVTNGTLLTREVAEKLVPLGLTGAKFTLDGPPEIHNGERPFASGAGSFDAIVDNMASIWDLVPINLGGNFRECNYLEFPRLLDLLVSRGITPEKLRHVQFTPVTPQAGCADQSSGCASSDAPWLVDALMYLRGEILSRGFKTSRPGVSACVVELEDNIVVNCEGKLYKCPAFMGWEGLSVGSLAEGMKQYHASHCIGNWQTEECLECCYLPLCFGGCRFLTLSQGKLISDVDCKRQFLDATLERILQQNLTCPAAGTTPA